MSAPVIIGISWSPACISTCVFIMMLISDVLSSECTFCIRGWWCWNYIRICIRSKGYTGHMAKTLIIMTHFGYNAVISGLPMGYFPSVVFWNCPFIYDKVHLLHGPFLWISVSNLEMSRIMTKPTKWSVLPAKTQISLGIRPVWSESSLSAWRSIGSLAILTVKSKKIR